jgi:DNA polymerase-3 subunit delta
MRLKVDQLGAAVRKTLAPVYLICGDEPLQLGEAADEIRSAAKLAGYANREVLSIDNGAEWRELTTEAGSLSIFSEKKLIDLRASSVKPGVDGGKILVNYAKNLPEDTLLLLTAGKIDSAGQKSQWFQALDNVGVVVQVWPLQGADLLQWLQRRAERKGMRMDADAVKCLALRIEGHLLAAAQEIEKLYILHGQSRISKAMVEDQVADSARFDVFNLSEALLQGKLNRAVKILHGLKAEGVAAPVVLWALSREARLLSNVQADLQQGGQLEAIFKKYQVWDKRKQMLQAALQRLKTQRLHHILQLSAKADMQIKGQLAGDGWETLFAICLQFINSPEF